MATNKDACFSHNTDEWRTPKDLYDYFMSKGYVDPCPFQCEQNNLTVDFGDVNLFINPPYSDIKSWVDFSIKHIKNHPNSHVLLLIPSRTDTKYYQRMLEENIDMGIYFFKGRLHFNESVGGAPFPSCLIKINLPVGKKYIMKDY